MSQPPNKDRKTVNVFLVRRKVLVEDGYPKQFSPKSNYDLFRAKPESKMIVYGLREKISSWRPYFPWVQKYNIKR